MPCEDDAVHDPNAQIAGAAVSHETGFVGFHQNRLTSVTLNYLDGSMDDTADNTIRHFLGSLQFVAQGY
jgi:hypothetical protein